MIDPEDGAISKEIIYIMVSPCDGNGYHACVASCSDVHGGVPDKSQCRRGVAQNFCQLECGCWVRFDGDAFLLADDSAECDFGKNEICDLLAERVGFVGENGYFDTFMFQLLERLIDSRKCSGALLPCLSIHQSDSIAELQDLLLAEIIRGGASFRTAARARAEALFGLDKMVDAYIGVLTG